MVEKRRGLGRGLGALISSAPAAEDEALRAERPAETEDDQLRENASSTAAAAEPFPEGPVSRETSTPQPVEPISDRRKESTDKEERPAGTRAARSRSEGKKPRPVDMFFSSGASAEEAVDEAPATPGRGPGTGKGRAAMPDVLGQVRQRRDDGASKPSGASADGENVQPSSEFSPAVEGAEAEEKLSDPAGADAVDVPRETLVQVPGAEFAEIEIGSIHPNRKQPRSVFDEDDMAELVHSIKEVGLLQPIVVRPSDEGGTHSYELVMGERRWRAVQMAGLNSIPAIVRQTPDTDLLRDALLENLHRSQLNPLEEAAAYQQLMQEFDCTQEELSDRIGRSRPQISNTIRLMKLPALVQRRVAAGVLSAGHARALLGLSDAGEMERLAQRIVNEGLSVRATEEIVSLSDGLRRSAREKPNRTAARHERLDYLANSLSDHLDTTVKITLGAKKGRVSIEFGSVDDLNRIMGVIAPSKPE